jgi:anti-anti-sigma factor
MTASSIDPGYREGAIRADSEPDGIIAVCLEGDFDLANAPLLREHVHSALETGNNLIVDLSEATFIDSSVISVLFDAAKAVHGRDQTVVLQLATTPIVEQALELVGIESVLPRAHSRTEAVQIIERKAASR